VDLLGSRYNPVNLKQNREVERGGPFLVEAEKVSFHLDILF